MFSSLGILSGWIGRKKVTILCSPIVMCGWLVIGFAQNKMMLFFGRIISGGESKVQNYVRT